MDRLETWEKIFEAEIRKIATSADPAHDSLHFSRVVGLAKQLCAAEGANFNIVVPAAWLHDFVVVPKDSHLRSKASKMSAERAIQFLQSIDYPNKYFDDIAHAIEGHSFSANIEVKTLEAKIVQDADRLDGIGAIGVARCFATSGLLKRPFYSSNDPFCDTREPDDSVFTLDHFYKKLFKTAQTLKTESGRIEGHRRVEAMQDFLTTLRREIFL